MTERPDLLSFTRGELRDYAVSIGEKPYRGDQIFSFLSRGVSYGDMTSLSLALREKLASGTEFRLPTVLTKKRSRDGLTEKYLLSLIDGECVECVLMRHDYGTSLCISSQVGCRMGCKFCASTIDGVVRGLTPAEMLEQIYRISEDVGE
ncbi:MAG: 23S rRNA (adenine(2503)-C(2))-methyltransferase RlmN, partial [Clostridia bacterium]|nr:23S rRNA (adenine(2503)-C(2))-methyltransferase RlmN [Clostridia bacterium]